MNARRSAARLLMAAAAALIGAGIVEQGARAVLFGRRAFSYRLMASERGAPLFRAAPDPEVVVEFKPGVNALFKMAELKTNAFGMTDVERSTAPGGAFRIAPVGEVGGQERHDLGHLPVRSSAAVQMRHELTSG